VVRLGSALPFSRAAEALASVWGVRLSASVTRAATEAAGAVHVAAWTAAALLRADRAMVLLVGGDWAEARTLAIEVAGPHRRPPVGMLY
jgi:phage-related tail protein